MDHQTLVIERTPLSFPFLGDRYELAGGDGDRDAGPARQPECPDSPGKKPAHHTPVMPRECLSLLAPERGGIYVDATVGPGGHAELILSSSQDTRLIGIDRDAESLELARERLAPFGGRVTLVHDDYRRLRQILPRLLGGDESSCLGILSGLMVDFGISSWQLSGQGRGFSFLRDEPLDMRMDRSRGRSAAEVIAAEDEEELARIFYEYAEERRSRRVARAIVERRRHAPIHTTLELAALIEHVIPRRGARIHPATRVFQALRIAVNEELEGIDRFLVDSTEALKPGGRLVLLTFHSLEDRIVKTSLRALSHRCVCPRGLPRCACHTPDLLTLLTRKPLRPSREEVESNPRSRSAKLRAAERS